MKKAFEKFRMAKQYISEKNHKKLTTMLNDIINSNSNSILGFGFHFDNDECFEKITNRMIVCELSHMTFTEPEFFDNKSFHNLCCKAEESFKHLNWENPQVCFDHFLMSSVEKENRINVIRLILKKFQHNSYSDEPITSYMKNVVWYTAFEDDDKLLEEIYNLAANEISPVYNSEIKPWMWMYLNVIIEKNDYDLLDKTIPLIYGQGNYDFTSLYSTSLTNMTYSEFIRLLYRRYCPEMSDSQIAEKLLCSIHLKNLHHPLGLGYNNLKKECECIMNLNIKTNIANCILALWIISGCSYSQEYLYGFLKDKPVLYMNDKWFDLCVTHNKFIPDRYEFLTRLLDDIPDITLSIDNCNNLNDVNFMINSIQLEEFFSKYKPVLTDKVCDNQLLKSLINSNSKKLRPLLKALILNEKAKEDLIKLCVRSKNTYALNIINEQWSQN